MTWRTSTGRRPDLEVLEVNAPEGYIGGLIYPQENKAEKTGTIYYCTVDADATAQTGRNPQTGAITRSFIGTTNTTYAAAEVIARKSVQKDEVGNMGGIAKADLLGGKLAKRAVMAKLESMHATQLFTGSANAVAAGKFFDAMATGAQAIKKYRGPTALVCSLAVYRHIITLDEVISRLSFTGLTLKNREEVMSIAPGVLLDMLQNIFAVNKILIGDDEYWSTAALAGKAAIVKLPDQIEMSYKEGAELGKTFTYMMDGGNMFEIESSCDDSLKVNDYDATTYAVIKELNAGAKYLLSGLKPAAA